jgi:hypothetical protein
MQAKQNVLMHTGENNYLARSIQKPDGIIKNSNPHICGKTIYVKFMSTHPTSNLGPLVQMQGNSYGKSCTLLIQIASIKAKWAITESKIQICKQMNKIPLYQLFTTLQNFEWFIQH